jgi:hypothetical protein
MKLTQDQVCNMLGTTIAGWIAAGADPADVRDALHVAIDRWDELILRIGRSQALGERARQQYLAEVREDDS